MTTTTLTADQFYGPQTNRFGGETDFGCFWTDPLRTMTGWTGHTFRVTLIDATREVYATDGRDYILLGTVSETADPEVLLKGWAEACLDHQPYTWVQKRLRGHVYTTAIHAAKAWAKRHDVGGAQGGGVNGGGWLYRPGGRAICKGYDSLAHILVSRDTIVLTTPKLGICSPAWIQEG